MSPAAGAEPRLSVAQLQQALRVVRQPPPVGPTSVSWLHRGHGDRDPGAVEDSASRTTVKHWDDPAVPPSAAVRLPAGYPGGYVVGLMGAHGGAGATTVALAVAEAACEADGGAHLVECDPDGCGGLAAAATAELGTVAGWRRGTRGALEVYRVGDPVAVAREGWPDPPAAVTVVDLGATGGVEPVAVHAAALVVVCRGTVPGLRRAETLLHRLPGVDALAVVGAGRWPAAVRGSVGPLLAAMQQSGRVVTVPVARHLETTGLTGDPLPRTVAAAGRELMAVLGPPAQGAGSASPLTADAQARPRPIKER